MTTPIADHARWCFTAVIGVTCSMLMAPACSGGSTPSDTPPDASTDSNAMDTCTETSPPTGPKAIYLAFDGVTLEGVGEGEDDATRNRFSLTTGTSAFPAFWASAPDRGTKIAEVVQQLERIVAPFGVRVTTERPSEDHMMVVFAGETRTGLIGLVRHDCGNSIKNDVILFFDDVAKPGRGRFAIANETIFSILRTIGLAKSSRDGHPCSCDPSGNCENDEPCRLSRNAKTVFGTCSDSPPVQDEMAALARVFGCQ